MLKDKVFTFQRAGRRRCPNALCIFFFSFFFMSSSEQASLQLKDICFLAFVASDVARHSCHLQVK